MEENNLLNLPKNFFKQFKNKVELWISFRIYSSRTFRKSCKGSWTNTLALKNTARKATTQAIRVMVPARKIKVRNLRRHGPEHPS